MCPVASFGGWLEFIQRQVMNGNPLRYMSGVDHSLQILADFQCMPQTFGTHTDPVVHRVDVEMTKEKIQVVFWRDTPEIRALLHDVLLQQMESMLKPEEPIVSTLAAYGERTFQDGKESGLPLIFSNIANFMRLTNPDQDTIPPTLCPVRRSEHRLRIPQGWIRRWVCLQVYPLETVKWNVIGEYKKYRLAQA